MRSPAQHRSRHPAGGPARRVRRLGVLLLLLAAGTACSARAEEPTLLAEALPSTVRVGETFVYRITVAGGGVRNPTPTVNLPSTFQIISGPNSSMSIEVINGRMTSRSTISYTLRATRSGKWTIPGPEIRIKRKVLRGNPVDITVRGAGTAPSQQPGSSKTPRRTAPSATSPTFAPGEEMPDIFLKVDVEPGEVYLQQPLQVTYTLYFLPTVRNYDVQRLSSTDGFWTEKIPTPDPPPIVSRRVGNKVYNAAVIHRLLLFPTRTGELTIGPMELTCEAVRRGSRRRSPRGLFDSFFEDPFFTSTRTVEVASDPVTVKVKPLPAEGRPADFGNTVGKYKITAKLDRDTVETNESVSLTVRIRGSGNIGFIPEPKVVVPPDIERYDPQVEMQKQPVGSTLQGRKVFTYLLIPRRAGLQRIAPIRLSYFDPENGRYRTVQTPPLNLVVLPASGWAAAESDLPGGSPREVENVGSDIRWIHDSARSLRRVGAPPYLRWTYWAAYLVPLGIAGLGLGLRRRQRRLAGDESARRRRRAARRARAALKQARNSLAAGKVEEGYTALARGLLNYLSDRTGVPAVELDPARIRDELAGRGLEEAAREGCTGILATCNQARFTPEGADGAALGSLIERADRWIRETDRRLAGGR